MDNKTSTTITIPLQKYEEMINRLARFNALINIIREEIDKGNNYPVKDEIVLMFTGLRNYRGKKEAEK